MNNLQAARDFDFSQEYTEFFELFADISTRDRDGVQKTFSGLMKILFPHQEAIAEEMEWVFALLWKDASA